MRADRLISILISLQVRGVVTAKTLASELEVSERTIYRDVDALSSAGVPIFANRGPGGGFQLIDNYRTNLTGLNPDEMRALFLLGVPDPLAELGVARPLRSALEKLSAALPAYDHSAAAVTRQRVYLDSQWWHQARRPAPYLQTIQRAVWQERSLRISYSYPLPLDTTIEMLLDPYGLVAKTNVWYVVGRQAGRTTAFQVSRIRSAEALDGRFQRPDGFELETFWNGWCAEQEKNRPRYPVKVKMSLSLTSSADHFFGNMVDIEWLEEELPRDDRWKWARLTFQDLAEARRKLLALGGAIEVVAPEALRLSMADFARQTVERYRR